MLEGKTNNATNNRDTDIQPCLTMSSDVEMVLWKATEDHPPH
jgi:hypothetical protein